MLSGVPNPSHWTLRFKQNKTTVLLFVTPTQSFSSIKSNLLEAIRATGVTSIGDKVLPSNPEDVIFGVPIDKNNISKGWVGLEIPEFDEEMLGAKKGKGVKKGSVLNSIPQGAGLKDGGVVAFRFRQEGNDELEMIEHEEWNVIVPSYTDEEDEVATGAVEAEEDQSE